MISIDIKEGTLKMRTGNYVVYDINYLLNNFEQERELLRSAYGMREITDRKPLDWEIVIDEVREFNRRMSL